MAEVLIVDDEPAIRRLVQMVLELEGHQVVTAGSGPQALDRVEERPPDVMLLDLRLPGMDGWEVLRRVDALNVDTRVVMLTAVQGADRRAAAAAGVLAKPFDVDHLVQAVERLAPASR